MASVEFTENAREVLQRVRASRAGVLTISIDTGCCEGTAPHLYEDYMLPYGSTAIGEADGVSVYVPPHLAALYENASIVIDAVDEEASDVMSIETSLGKRLVLRHV